jgi:Zn-finger nucleic acid-binding protein
VEGGGAGDVDEADGHGPGEAVDGDVPKPLVDLGFLGGRSAVGSTVMKCPVDDSTLSISTREGIEIDFCPQCRGVWLDRGELDKVIERTATSLAPTGGGPVRPQYDDRRHDDDRRYEDRRYQGDRRYGDDDDRRQYGNEHGRGKRKKKGSFLSDLFEFGGE